MKNQDSILQSKSKHIGICSYTNIYPSITISVPKHNNKLNDEEAKEAIKKLKYIVKHHLKLRLKIDMFLKIVYLFRKFKSNFLNS